ncbi:MAG: hypothetical protein IPK46_02545 [Saprospiraceae bacterium]|nr:hypothetical protein [Saprospiraceae bacterium]
MAFASAMSKDTLKFQHFFNFEARAKHNIYGNQKETINSLIGKYTTDNPFTHMGIYSSLNYQAKYNAYHFDIRLLSEERSQSGGNNFIGNLRVFPKITFSFLDSFQLFNDYIEVTGMAGDFWDEDIGDNLRFYNIDYNALNVKFKRKNYYLGYFRVGDLSNNIGLYLEEADKIFIGWHKKHYNVEAAFESNYLLGLNSRDHNLSSSLTVKDDLPGELRMQISYRLNQQLAGKYPVSIFLGYKYKGQLANYRINLRYYSAGFNRGYFEKSRVNYRGNNASPYVGNQIYPLKNYFRPLNQWAFFTENQNSNILNLEFTFSNKFKIYKSVYFVTDLDANINLRNKNLFVYPIYDIGISIIPIKNIEFRLSGTNKIMNLDNEYQTFYITKNPCLSFEIHKSI